MAKFTVDVNGSSVQIELTFNAVRSNTWSTIAGDTSLLPAVSGTWDSSGVENIVNFQDEQAVGFMVFTEVQIDVVSIDRFKNLKPGDTGAALLNGVEAAMWIFDEPDSN